MVTTMATVPMLTAAHARLCCRRRRSQSQPSKMGKIPAITGLVNAAKPRRTPNPAYRKRQSVDPNERASRNSNASSNATKEWYHIVAAEKLIAYGKKAHPHPARLAVRRSKFLRAMRKTGTEVNAEKKLFKLRKTNADAFV